MAPTGAGVFGRRGWGSGGCVSGGVDVDVGVGEALAVMIVTLIFSIGFDARALDHLGPLLELGVDQALEFCR